MSTISAELTILVVAVSIFGVVIASGVWAIADALRDLDRHVNDTLCTIDRHINS